MSGAGENRHKKILTAAGAVILAAVLMCVAFFCTSLRIDPDVRIAYDTNAGTQTEDEDFAQLLEMLGDGPEEEEEEEPAGKHAFTQYGLSLAASAAAGLLLFILLLPREKRYAGFVTGCCSAALGFLLARLVFWLCTSAYYLNTAGDWLTLFRVRDGGLSMTGALLGAGLGCLLGARICRGSGVEFPMLADAMAPGAVLFVACERCHEWALLGQNYGLAVKDSGFFAAEGELGPVLNMARISSLAALVILAVLLAVRPARKGARGLLFLLLYGTVQVLMESLRQDLHMLWGFVHAQQLFAFLAAFGAVMVLAAEQGKRKSALAVSLLTAGCVTALEFALDGRIRWPFSFLQQHVKLCWYVVFCAVMAAYLIYGVKLLRGNRKEEEVR